MKRHKNIVGKWIGCKLYLHREYADLMVPDYRRSLGLLWGQYPGWQFNVVVWHSKKDSIRFCASPDFDTASEPIVGLTVTVCLSNGEVGKAIEYRQVYHRKHLFVKQSYSGFDVEAAERWAECWSSKLIGREPIDGSSRPNWLKQLERNGIPLPK